MFHQKIQYEKNSRSRKADFPMVSLSADCSKSVSRAYNPVPIDYNQCPLLKSTNELHPLLLWDTACHLLQQSGHVQSDISRAKEKFIRFMNENDRVIRSHWFPPLINIYYSSPESKASSKNNSLENHWVISMQTGDFLCCNVYHLWMNQGWQLPYSAWISGLLPILFQQNSNHILTLCL